MDKNQIKQLLHQLMRIANALETVIDQKRRTLRMVDVDRAKVYGKHLGKKLRK